MIRLVCILVLVCISLSACDLVDLINAYKLRKPNFLFISVDDMNSWTSFLGGDNIPLTPNLTELSESSYVFTEAHANASICNPSRLSVLTGKLAHNTGVFDNYGDLVSSIKENSFETILSYFKKHGYRNYGYGKILHSYEEDVLQLYDDYDFSIKFSPVARRDLFWSVTTMPEEAMNDSLIAMQAKNVLLQKHKQPFLLTLGFHNPHIPWIVPGSYLDIYKGYDIKLPLGPIDDWDDLPDYIKERLSFNHKSFTGLDEEEHRNLIRAYLASVTFLDVQLGNVLNGLYKGPNVDNTIVVFWSDHGFHLGEKEMFRKESLWRSATHVPLLIHIPDKLKRSKFIRQVVSLVDLFPTMIDLANLPKLDDLDGESLVKFMKPGSQKQKHAAVLISQDAGSYAVLTDKWKYIRYMDASEELYDLSHDLNEFKNLASDDNLESIKNDLAALLPSN